jgi:hypothetical protein
LKMGWCVCGLLSLDRVVDVVVDIVDM